MLNLRKDINFTIPCAMIQHLSFAEQIKTVKSLGFQEFTLHPFHIGIYNNNGVMLRDMKTMVEDAGLKINRIDPFAHGCLTGRQKNLAMNLTSCMLWSHLNF